MVNLPLPGDPLVMLGKVVEPESLDDTDSPEIHYTSREILPRLLTFVPVVEMGLRDTPEKDSKDQIALTAVIGLRLMGIDTADIATMFGVSTTDVTKMLEKPAAQVTFEHMFVAMINHNATTVQGRVSSHANKAIDVVVSLMNGEKVRSDVRLKAAQDVLDRSGSNADNFFGQNSKSISQEDELKISYMTDDGEKEKITVSLKRK